MLKQLLLLSPALLFAQSPPLTLREAVSRALSGNPSLSALSAGEDAARARITQARAGALPKINYAESVTRSDNPVFVFSSLLTQRQFAAENFALGALNRPDFLNNFQSQLLLEQPIFDAGQTRRAVRNAELSLNWNQEDSRRGRMQLIAAVVRLYFDAQLSASQLEVTRQSLRSAEADLARAEARRAAGMATDADVLSVRVHLASVREQQASRSADLEVAHASLNDALGLPLGTEHALATALTPVLAVDSNQTELEAQALTSRAELIQAKLSRDLAATQLADARSRYLPQVTARAALEANRQSFVTRGGANWLFAVGLRWNLFNGGADKARIAEAQSGLRRAEALAKSVDSSVRLELRRAYAHLHAAQERIATAQSALAEAEESLRILQNRYDAGLATVTDLLRTESALLETRSRHLAAIHQQRLAATQLALAASTLTPDSELLQ